MYVPTVIKIDFFKTYCKKLENMLCYTRHVVDTIVCVFHAPAAVGAFFSYGGIFYEKACP